MMDVEITGSKSLQRTWVWVGVMLAFAVGILAAGWWGWAVVRAYPFLRVHVLVAEIVTGVGATMCLAGAMELADRWMEVGQPRGWVRWSVALGKRVVLVLELATMGVALAAAGVLIFGFKIPGV